MKAPREYRRWLNRVRAKFGRKNGVVPSGCLDSPAMDRKLANSKRVVQRVAVAATTVMLLSGMSCTRFIRPDPVPAQCDAVCYVSDAKDDADTACASRSVWTGDRNDPKAWDNLVYGVIPSLRKETWDCGIRLKACQQCIDRLVKAGVIAKP